MDRKHGETRHAVTSIVSQIEASHRRIRSDLEVLEKSDDLRELRTVVDELPGLLKEHFRDEEKPGGLFQEMQSLRPVLDSQLVSLRHEHREIMKILEGLRRQLHEVDGVTEVDDLRERHDQIRVSAAVLIQLIHKHERVESRLVGDTYYVEDGGSG